ncbi:MAG: dTDP-4-dehydrorhamnose reductase [Rhodospirillaceae bacterium]|jgi:dTDP-4-dehydrorhamnose reductase|nr:dTDP-4-dehydrorhamnose reductase [Rhodospirillaceae bacterium]|tara:strand:- start:949 stop:1833 length:885 start_codon:yes stop_codon:yes gene_type:complete
MKVIVIGKGGQLGYELMRFPLPSGIDRAGFGRTEVDITDQTAVKSLFRDEHPDVIINVAAYTDVDKAETDHAAAFAVNEKAPRSIASACAETGACLIHLSTDFVFDGTKKEPYTENDAVNPINVYGESKAAGEQAVREVLDRHIILRTSWLFGRHGSNFVKTILRLGEKRDSLSIVDDERGCPTSAFDLARAILELTAQISEHMRWGTYHYAGRGATTWYGLAGEIFLLAEGAFGQRPILDPISAREYSSPARRPANSVLDCTRISTEFGIEPVDWRNELRSVVQELLGEEAIP